MTYAQKIFREKLAASAPDWRAGLALLPTRCDNCSGVPMGDGCYRICPNSSHFYSPERERADDVFYGDDDIRERYAAEIIDGELEDFDSGFDFYTYYSLRTRPTPVDPDDIPF